MTSPKWPKLFMLSHPNWDVLDLTPVPWEQGCPVSQRHAHGGELRVGAADLAGMGSSPLRPGFCAHRGGL